MKNCCLLTVITRNYMRCRVSNLLRFYLLTALVFVAAKVVFMLFNSEGHEFGLADVGQVIWHGLPLDLSTALYILILPFLLTVVSVWTRVPRWIYAVYYGVIAVAFALAFVADTSLYPFWGFKLDASCLQYLDTPTEAMASVSVWYLLLRGLAVLLVAALLFWLYWRVTIKGEREKRSPMIAKMAETACYLMSMPLIVIGIRGGLDESTTNVGQVYYSPKQFLNHAAVNPVFSFLSSMEKTASYVPEYQFVSDEECAQLLAELYPTESIAIDTLLTTQRPNVVVILMESCGAIFTGLEGRADVMPRLEQLMNEGVSFDSCYANSWRTDRGTVCTYSGYPSFPVSSVMKMPSKSRLLPGLARTLAGEGYQTSYIYGGDINFTNMRSYLVGTGFERLTWKKDFTADEQQSAKWGVRDDITFKELARQIAAYDAQQQPFFIGLSTLSSHEPWDVPLKQMDDEILNAFYYLDHCIGSFVDDLRQTPAWQNLLVILLPDHGIDFYDINFEDPRHDHIPMVWTGGAVKTPRRLKQVCNQTDLPATLLGQMGLPHADYRYSRDVMSCNYQRRVAVHTYNNGIAVVDSTGRAIFDLNANSMIQGQGPAAEEMIRIGKAVLQSAASDLRNLQ